MKLEKMRELLRQSLAPKRYKHSLAVYETALELAKAHALTAEETEKTAVSALLHDCGREVPTKESAAKARELGIAADEIELSQPILLHEKLGVYYARHKYGVTDAEVLAGIRYHTTGAPDMTVLAKIVFLADMTEPARDFPGISELRSLCRRDLDKAMLAAYGSTLAHLAAKGQLIHPDCIAGYNQLLLAQKAAK